MKYQPENQSVKLIFSKLLLIEVNYLSYYVEISKFDLFLLEFILS